MAASSIAWRWQTSTVLSCKKLERRQQGNAAPHQAGHLLVG